MGEAGFYQKTAASGCVSSIKGKEFVDIMGPSGCGKPTAFPSCFGSGFGGKQQSKRGSVIFISQVLSVRRLNFQHLLNGFFDAGFGKRADGHLWLTIHWNEQNRRDASDVKSAG